MKKYILVIIMLSFLKLFAQQTAVAFADFSKYEAENTALPIPQPDQDRVVFMGNSITEGWKNTHPYFFEENPYIDRGISGQTTSQMLLRFRRDVIDLQPKVVVLLAGINDIAENTGPVELKDVFGNIISMVDLAQANQIKVVVCSVVPANNFPWRKSIKPADKVIALNTMMQQYCGENNIVYVDYYNAMVNDKKGLGKDLAEDGVHPTSKGYKIMEPLVKAGIKQALNR
ncbi:SGNH/GDSL hydrolase family protein [Galbibacter sp. EGI 63066]|uniref:SGNH/GDSL hydrolase family protein n=1 Tax=Galbibacter sp. EGI 63066 TaxID=2993559 RepID=UPI00224989D3|nr:SGNH/GDSL hydrolase family protein [Galbibacter sp. EGI 63066]MCX2678449.1 SGNH/GDSL hydrolase family protein [Galbibacter sp. EGI 63066]